VGRGLAKLLLVHQEPIECRSIADHLRRKTGADVEITLTAPEGIEKMTGGLFDLALIHALSPEKPALELAAVAASRSIPVLWLSGDSVASVRLRRLGYQYLEMPFDRDLLVSESERMVVERRRLLDGVAASASKMEFNLRLLKTEIAESYRLFDSIMRRLGYEKTLRR
jgi:DNA-binding NtrC family response regulator